MSSNDRASCVGFLAIETLDKVFACRCLFFKCFDRSHANLWRRPVLWYVRTYMQTPSAVRFRTHLQSACSLFDSGRCKYRFKTLYTCTAHQGNYVQLAAASRYSCKSHCRWHLHVQVLANTGANSHTRWSGVCNGIHVIHTTACTRPFWEKHFFLGGSTC